jgi:hypothetical protein
LQSLAAKSGVTVANIESLALYSQSISQAGYHFNPSSLQSVISELAQAVAGGTSTTAAQTAWNNLFTNASVSTTVINNTFNDLVTTITDSNVTTSDLSTVASDEAAIQKDLSNLFPHHGMGSSGATDPPALLATDSVSPLTVTAPSAPGVSTSAVQGVVNSLPVVTQPLIVSPGIPAIFPWGVNLFGSLNHVGVVTGPVVPFTPGPISLPMMPANSNFQKLLSDEQALESELQSLAAKSGSDSRRIGEPDAGQPVDLPSPGAHLAFGSQQCDLRDCYRRRWRNVHNDGSERLDRSI